MITDRSIYTILPFRFVRFGPDVLVVNEAGEYIFISGKDFERLRSHDLHPKEEIFLDLKNKHVVADTDLTLPIYLLATKYRTKKSFINDFTALHIFVITLRCNQKCRYCQVSSEDENRYDMDMNIETAKKCVDLVFRSRSPNIKIEFQGGEPLLNFEIVRYIVEYAKKLNKIYRKSLEFVICTNLLGLQDEILSYLRENEIWVSTSLDGPRYFHDTNRISRKGIGTYNVIKESIRVAQDRLGIERVSALMVTTRDNIHHLDKVVDEYISQRFNAIFIRSLHSYGRALDEKLGYDVITFVDSYIKVLNYILKLNLEGIAFSEQYATILLSKILTPFATGFVDLQSPVGVSCVAYDFNGDVYISDEARMLAKMGKKRFLMGNVYINTYEEIFRGKTIREIVESSCVETMPLCSECAFQTYCGADPVRNYCVQGDLLGHRPTSEFHQINFFIIRHLFELIKQNDPQIMNVFWSWITNRSVEEIKGIKRG